MYKEIKNNYKIIIQIIDKFNILTKIIIFLSNMN